MLKLLTASVAASEGQENEDAIALGDGAAVVVDGAGLPKDLRRGCNHSVHWYAAALASAFRDHLVRRGSDMRDALAAAITEVADSHSDTCHLTDGSPSATVAAWRLQSERVEYLVLCDASIILALRDRPPVEITDDRMARATAPLIEERLHAIQHARPVMPVDIRLARRAAVEQTRNRPDGFWCCQFDPQAAVAATTGWVDRGALTSVIAATDGATRGYRLLGIHTLDDLVHAVHAGDAGGVIASVRKAEESSTTLAEQGMKKHDDATIVALSFC